MNLFQIEYGFCYSGRIGSYSQGYITGVVKNTSDLTDITRTQTKYYDRWKIGHVKITSGFIRDIFTENVLSENHFSLITLNGKRIDELISVDERFGTMKKIFNNYLWKVNETHLGWVRTQFYPEDFFV